MNLRITAVLFLLPVLSIQQDYQNYNNNQWEEGEHGPKHYVGKHYYYGPLYPKLPLLKAYEARAITDRAEWTKRQVKDRLDEWVRRQPEKVREIYNAFDKASKVRVLQEKLDHEQHIANQANEVRDLDRRIQEHLDNLDITWYQTCRRINDVKRDADPKILKALRIERRTKCGINVRTPDSEDHKNPESFEDFGKKPTEEEGYHHGMNNGGQEEEDIYDQGDDNNDYNNNNNMYG
ncbi:unnamed protein product [Bursaphelenchus xylophilus]|uniref:(pine wood nematode) hypothetical protein n=1 Tax=Bursaphelenchus xylophilus TaxID=6326 RepID=A0A1I7SD35_BURXY|nr:unnamed protein product [Bursaphelenchus xylophilus]CAG9093006.1 unnamed protein product [Bursaphelenchus xylophilus]